MNALTITALYNELERTVVDLPPGTEITDAHMPFGLRIGDVTIALDTMARYGYVTTDGRGIYKTPLDIDVAI